MLRDRLKQNKFSSRIKLSTLDIHRIRLPTDVNHWSLEKKRRNKALT